MTATTPSVTRANASFAMNFTAALINEIKVFIPRRYYRYQLMRKFDALLIKQNTDS